MATPTPYVRGYQSQVEPTALPGTPQAPVLDEGSRALGQFAGALDQTADILYKADTDRAVMQAHDQIAQGMIDITQHTNELKQTTFGKDPTGYTPAVHKVVDDYGTKLVNQTTNPTAKRYIADTFARLGMHQVEQASNWERAQQDRYRASQIADQTKSYVALVAADTSGFDAYRKTLHDGIDAANLSPDVRERVLEATDTALRAAAVESDILNNPRGAYDALGTKLGLKNTKPALPNPVPTPGSAAPAVSGPATDPDIWGGEANRARDTTPPPTASPYGGPGGVDPALEREIVTAAKTAAKTGDASAVLALWNERGTQIAETIKRQKDIDLGIDPNTGVPMQATAAAPAAPAAAPVQIASSGEIATDTGPMPLDPQHTSTGGTTTGKAYIDELTTQQAVEYRNRAHSQILTGQAGARAELERRMQNVEQATKAGMDPGEAIPDSLFDAAYPDKPTADAKRATYQAWKDFGTDVNTISTMPNDQIPAYLENIKPTDTDAVDFAARMQRWTATTAAAQHVLKARAEDGVAGMNKQGMYPIGPLFDEQGNLSETELNRRQQNSMSAQGVYLTQPLVFTKPEAKSIGASIATATFKQQSAFLGALRRGLPDAVTFRAAIQQIAPDAPEVALAATRYNYQPGYALAEGFDSLQKNAEDILRGKAVLHPSKQQKEVDGVGGNLIMPASDKMQTEFAAAVGDAYTGQPGALRNDFQVVRYLYAAYAADAGLVVDPQNKDPNPDLLKKAILGATGGLYTQGDHKLIKPYGMPDDVFAQRYATAYHDALIHEGVDPATHAPSDYPGLNVAPGVYNLRTGMDTLKSKFSGEPIQVVVPTGVGEPIKQKSFRDYLPSLSLPSLAEPPARRKEPAGYSGRKT